MLDFILSLYSQSVQITSIVEEITDRHGKNFIFCLGARSMI